MASKEKKKSIYDSIKERLENTGTGGKIFFTSAGDKKKIRFLIDFEDAIVIDFHSSKYGVDNRFCHPCLKYYGKKCPHCGDKEANHDSYYAYLVYDYKSSDVKLFIYKANKCSPIPSLMALYEEYGTIVDRDYTIKQTGEQTSKSFDFLGADKKKFKVEVDTLTEKAIYEIIKGDKYLYNVGEGVDEDEEEEDDEPVAKKAKKKAKPAPVEEDEDDDEEEEEEVVVKKKKKPVEEVKKKKKKVVEEDYDDEDDDEDDD